MANIPAFTTDNISLGPGIVFIGPVGATPTVDVGAIQEDGIEFTVTRELLEVFQGSPKSRIANFVTGETVEMTAQTLEWNLLNLPFAMGTGVTTSSATIDTYAFGSDPDLDEVALRIQHALPSGHTVLIDIWRAQPIGEWTMTLAQDELQQFPFGFRALVATTEWDGSALPVGEQLFRITREKPT